MSIGISSGTDDYERKSRSSVRIDIETLRLHVSSLVARIQSRVSIETLRPLHVFLGVHPVGMCVSVGAFTPPVKNIDKGAPEKVKSRMKLNFAYFLSNYVLVAAMVALVVALMHPGMLLFVGIVWALWGLHSFLLRNELVLFGIQVQNILTVQQRFYLLFTLTTLVVIWKCLMPTIFFLTISSFIIVSHALLRDPKNIEATVGESDEDDDEEGLQTGSGGSSGSEVLVDKPRGDVI